MPRYKFNDSSRVSACLNYENEKFNFSNSPLHSTKLLNEHFDLLRKEMYMSQYKSDFKAPSRESTNQMFNIHTYRTRSDSSLLAENEKNVVTGCKCSKCSEKEQLVCLEQPSWSMIRFDPRPVRTIYNRKNSLMDCFKDLKLNKKSKGNRRNRAVSKSTSKCSTITNATFNKTPTIRVEKYLNSDHKPTLKANNLKEHHLPFKHIPEMEEFNVHNTDSQQDDVNQNNNNKSANIETSRVVNHKKITVSNTIEKATIKNKKHNDSNKHIINDTTKKKENILDKCNNKKIETIYTRTYIVKNLNMNSESAEIDPYVKRSPIVCTHLNLVCEKCIRKYPKSNCYNVFCLGLIDKYIDKSSKVKKLKSVK